MLKQTRYFVAALMCGALLLMTASAQAALLSYTFSGTADSGALNGETLAGEFTFNDAGLNSSGFASLSLSSLKLNFNATDFALADADAGSLTTVDFMDGVFLGLSYTVSAFDPSFSLVSGLIDSTDAYFAYTPTALTAAGFGALTYTQQSSVIPVPGALWLFGSALPGLAVLLRKQRKSC